MRSLWAIVIVLGIIIVVLAWILFALPAPVHAPTTSDMVSSTPPSPEMSEPLHARVRVSEPQAGATVGKTFAVSGEAPGNWYFEAVFPIQVRDTDNNKIGQSQGQARGDWMTTAQVPFTATMTLNTAYSGPATLVLLRDNPSSLPENDDALEIPIMIR